MASRMGCTWLVNGKAVTTCATRVSSVDGKNITTIEGLANGSQLHPVQQAWLDRDVAQCGFCQPGQIMAAVDLLGTRATRKSTRSRTSAAAAPTAASGTMSPDSHAPDSSWIPGLFSKVQALKAAA